MNRVVIICNNYYKNQKKIIGGVETYVYYLSQLLTDNGYDVSIVQSSKTKFKINESRVNIYGIITNKIEKVISYCEKKWDIKNDILIFASDYLIKKNKFLKTIAIQHGIAWDITSNTPVSYISNVLNIFKGAFRSIKKINVYKNCSNLICVDYNFVNWFRTQVKHIDINLNVIPNFTKIPKKILEKDDKISIIFARRFVEYRGTRLFTSAILNILKKYEGVVITIAGEGPDKNLMEEKLHEYSDRVHFIKFLPNESIDIHMQHTIAVIPTCGSEGTSLSLLEAMASKCAVIATNVGGLTNILLNRYNGIIIQPDQKELENALSELIENSELRREISEKGYDTVSRSFSYENWSKQWLDVIEKVYTDN